MEREVSIWTALDGLGHFYAPYSHLHVSAALFCRDRKVYTDDNIENTACSPGIRVERCAFTKTVGGGERKSKAVVMYRGLDGRAGDYCPPYGVCRQVMWEFCNLGLFYITLAKSAKEYRGYALAQLLSESSGPDHLGGV